MNETIGNRIQKFRKEKGLTQEELAAKLDISGQAVSKWENDVSCPDISLLPLLCTALGISTDTLLNGSHDEVRLVPPEQRKSLDELTLRIRCVSSDGDKVRINLPMPLVKIALEVGMELTPNLNSNAMKALSKIDLAKIMDLAERGVIGRLIEAESADSDCVEVVVE